MTPQKYTILSLLIRLADRIKKSTAEEFPLESGAPIDVDELVAQARETMALIDAEMPPDKAEPWIHYWASRRIEAGPHK